jgi:hypothetical protein
MGNQVFNTGVIERRLVVAVEEFGIPEHPTDFYDKIDKVPSAKCLMLRLTPNADYKEETRSVPFRVWDPIAYYNGLATKTPGEAFWCFFNGDTKRWEVASSAAGSNVRVGIVRARKGTMFYEIELGSLPRSAFGGISGPDCTVDCDPCSMTYGEGTNLCAISILDPDAIVEGDGERILAYDTFSDKIPLIIDTDCVVARVSGISGIQSPYSNYGYGDGDPWVVLNGYHEHIVQYKEEWDCCDPTGPPTLIRKTPVILIGVECEPIDCEDCPEVTPPESSGFSDSSVFSESDLGP